MSEVIDAKMYFNKDNGELIFAHQWDGNLEAANRFLMYSEGIVCPDRLLVDGDLNLFGFKIGFDDNSEFKFSCTQVFCCKKGDYLILDLFDSLDKNNIKIAGKEYFEAHCIGEPIKENNVDEFYKNMATWVVKESRRRKNKFAVMKMAKNLLDMH